MVWSVEIILRIYNCSLIVVNLDTGLGRSLDGEGEALEGLLSINWYRILSSFNLKLTCFYLKLSYF